MTPTPPSSAPHHRGVVVSAASAGWRSRTSARAVDEQIGRIFDADEYTRAAIRAGALAA